MNLAISTLCDHKIHMTNTSSVTGTETAQKM